MTTPVTFMSHQWWLNFFIDLGANWVLQLLLGLLVLVLAVLLERLVFIVMRQGKPDELEAEMKKVFAGGYTSEAETRLRERLASSKQLDAIIVREGLSAHGNAAAANEFMQAALKREKLNFQRGLTFLGTIGNNAPFLGLLGTVLGIIKAFHDLSENLLGGSAAVMAGIAEALIATAIGLMVALPSVIAFNYLQSIIKNLLSRCEALGEVLVAYMQHTQGSPNPASSATTSEKA
jgi:biopolymer transport protein ExbB/TolQ